MLQMIKDCLCHPKYIVFYYKEKGVKIFLLIFLFFAAFVGAAAAREYSTDYFLNSDNEEIIQAIVVGEEPDMIRAAKMVTEDFRSGRIGRITLEHPEEWK